jgi:hypothetical protein
MTSISSLAGIPAFTLLGITIGNANQNGDR